MPGDKVQVSARISFDQRDAIRAHGGLVHLIHKFLADNSTEALASRETKKLESGSKNKWEMELRLLKKRRGLHKLKTPKEWERANKLSYLMQYASTGQLKKADEERIVQKMKLKPDMVIGWLHSPTPEHISLDHLEKARCHNGGILPNLQSLKEQERIREPFYDLLMKWLNLPTKEDVDIWIVQGFEKASGSTTDAGELIETGSKRLQDGVRE
ncbi:MAG: hypothetical protein J5U17_13075 [Candidatus Methanoperedens sp.]|nr:hypothetical protein [Candidatus Methanoperedens sp.]